MDKFGNIQDTGIKEKKVDLIILLCVVVASFLLVGSILMAVDGQIKVNRALNMIQNITSNNVTDLSYTCKVLGLLK